MNRQIKRLLATFSLVSLLISSLVAKSVIFPMGSYKWVSADAGTCNDADQGSISGTGNLVSYTAPSGQVITGVCIKSGQIHSTALTNGTHGNPFTNGCYTVTGVGTQTATVVRNFASKTCQEISHIDVYWSDPASPTPSTSPSALPSVSPSPSASPSVDPSQSPSASPSTEPSDDPSSEPSASPSSSPQSEASPSPSPSASPSAEASSTPPAPSSTPNPTDNPAVGGGEIADPGQVLGLSTTSGNYGLNSALVFALGIISTSAGLFLSRKKVI